MSTTTTATEISSGGGGGGGGAPDNATYLTTTSNATLSAEVVVGATPGGELGGTWASPTVDATHSGSSHAATQAAAEATAATALSGHTGDTSDAHDASAISFAPAGAISATDVQAAIEELDTEKSATGHSHSGYAPDSVDYLVGTASGSLSGEIVVGTTPGGELGGTWASPTVDATHSGSAHHTQSHNHSSAGDGTSLSPATLILPARTSSYPTTTGDIIYHSTLGALIVGSGGGQSFVMPVSGSTPATQAFGDAGTAGTADSTPHSDHKHPMPTLGYGLSGNSAPAVGLTNSTALATAETSISAATYADVTGVSLSLAAGTWLLIADVYGRIVNARAQMNVAITDSSNNIVREGTADIPASGAASVNASAHVGVHAIVSPGSTTTYKVRAARGNTSNTGTWTAMDGAATGTTNNASDNTDKATGLIAIRLA